MLQVSAISAAFALLKPYQYIYNNYLDMTYPCFLNISTSFLLIILGVSFIGASVLTFFIQRNFSRSRIKYAGFISAMVFIAGFIIMVIAVTFIYDIINAMSRA